MEKNPADGIRPRGGVSLAFGVLMALIAVSGILYATSACDAATSLDFRNGAQGPAAFGNNWKTWSIIALTTSGFLIALTYMLGMALENIPLLNRAKTDLNQFFATVIILAVFYGFVSSICSINTTQFGLSGPTLFDSAKSYFRYAESLSFAAYQSDMDAMMYISAVSSLYVGSAAMIPLGTLLTIQLSVRPFSGYSVMNGVLQFLSNAVSLSVALSTGYGVILDAIQGWFLNLLLPIGVVLRCFTPTRDFGGVLMSISIGLFIFYPLMFSLSYLMLGTPGPVSVQNESLLMPMLSLLGLFTAAAIIPFGVVGLIGYQFTLVSSVAATKAGTALGSIGGLVLPVFVLPAINWIIIVMLVRSLSKSMGEEVDISALSRMV